MPIKLAGSNGASKPGGLFARRAAASQQGPSPATSNPRMQRFANKLTLGSAHNSEDRLAIIRQKGQEMTQKYEDSKSKTFDAKYDLGKELGQGMHAQVFQCFLKTDTDKK
jgi:hypothetical protein